MYGLVVLLLLATGAGESMSSDSSYHHRAAAADAGGVVSYPGVHRQIWSKNIHVDVIRSPIEA